MMQQAVRTADAGLTASPDAEATAEQTLRTLVKTYGFDADRSAAAVAAIGDKSDVSLAVAWLLDHGEEDTGGAVQFIKCKHLDDIAGSPVIAPENLRL